MLLLHVSQLVLHSVVCATWTSALEAIQPSRPAISPFELEPEAAALFNPVRLALESLIVRPSCFRNATLKLIHDCRTLAVDLDDAQKAEYAVALTLCELSTAGVDGPPSCDSASYQAALCLRSLESRTQWWTSYSGYYRDITRMCYVARQDDQSINLLNLHRNVTDVMEALLVILRHEQSKATAELHLVYDEQQQLQNSLRAQWSSLVTETDAMKTDLLEEHERFADFVRQMLRALEPEVNIALSQVAEKGRSVLELLDTTEAIERAESHLETFLQTALDSSKEQVSDLQIVLDEALRASHDVSRMAKEFSLLKETVAAQQDLQLRSNAQLATTTSELEAMVGHMPRLDQIAYLGDALAQAEYQMTAFHRELDASREAAQTMHMESTAMVQTLVQEVSGSLNHLKGELENVEERLSQWTMSSMLLPTMVLLVLASLGRLSRLAVLLGLAFFLIRFYGSWSQVAKLLLPMQWQAVAEVIPALSLILKPWLALAVPLTLLVTAVLFRRWRHRRRITARPVALTRVKNATHKWQFVHTSQDSFRDHQHTYEES